MSEDIKVTDGTVLESLNNKVDLDGGNYAGSPLEEYIHKHCGGLEIGDIGFTQMAIDETKGKRRKLNGQLIIQDQYIQLTNIIKNSVALNPDLACTEAEWQTAVTMSEAGICYKYVIDDEAGTIRLPKYPNYFIGGLAGVAPVAGNGKTLGLMNGNGSYFGLCTNADTENISMFKTGGYNKTLPVATSSINSTNVSSYWTAGVTNIASESGIEAQLSNNQTEQIRGTYFIQVATGSETEDNIINEIELNNPFSLLDYKYSEYELNNISWLRSNGQWNSKAVYPTVYELLLKIYNGTETKAGASVKLYTETFTDYDFVLNTADETFRLPLLDGSESFIDYNNAQVLGASATITVPYNGYIRNTVMNESGVSNCTVNGVPAIEHCSNAGMYNDASTIFVKRGDVFKSNFTQDTTIFYKATGNGSLYFYVGETVQNANLINAGRIQELMLTRGNKEEILDWMLPDYTAGITGEQANNAVKTYTAPSDGWLAFNLSSFNQGTCYIEVNGINIMNSRAAGNPCFNSITGMIPVLMGDVITYFSSYTNNTYNQQTVTFYPMKGAN